MFLLNLNTDFYFRHKQPNCQFFPGFRLCLETRRRLGLRRWQRFASTNTEPRARTILMVNRNRGQFCRMSPTSVLRSSTTKTGTQTSSKKVNNPLLYNPQGDLSPLVSVDPVEEEVTFDGSVRSVYLESCRKNNVIPASYFLRHMLDPDVAMRHHGLGPEGIKPLSVALVVS